MGLQKLHTTCPHAFDGNMGHRHGHRPLLLHVHEPRHGPHRQHRPGLSHGLRRHLRLLTTGWFSPPSYLQTCPSLSSAQTVQFPFFSPVFIPYLYILVACAVSGQSHWGVFKWFAQPKDSKGNKSLAKVKHRTAKLGFNIESSSLMVELPSRLTREMSR